MERRKRATVVSICLFVLLILVCGAMAQKQPEERLYVLGTQAGLDLAKDFLTMLYNESVPVVTITGQFEQVKKEKYIIVLGGVREPGGLGEFVKQILTEQEQQESSKPGNEKMYVKENVFAKGQSIVVFAGADTAASAEARKKNRSRWMPLIGKWFDLDLGQVIAY
jgi:hypothetical protein